MSIIELLLKELDQEAVTTRKMLERVPFDQINWQPHEKSMVMGRLTSHVAELPGWIKMALTTEELDFATAPYTPNPTNNTAELLNFFEKSLAEGKEELSKTNETELEKMWTLRNGEEIYSKTSKYEVIRMSIAQTIHHRAQLGVYLRLLDIPIPGSYGPSADDAGF